MELATILAGSPLSEDGAARAARSDGDGEHDEHGKRHEEARAAEDHVEQPLSAP